MPNAGERLLVADASTVVALLLDSGPSGRWAAEKTRHADLYAPSLMPFECANVFRRHAQAGLISDDQASQAHADLVDLPIEFWPYEAIAARVWELRSNLTSYDAAYVAVAELLDATVLTLDRRLSRAPGLRCRIDCRA
ncbi:MAG TPA: type II toxin-antitoxin system VapC family toxin [Mycobacterium sp.]|nr:type II toxin-antitoxin system VapC family toxin [Mycobacterium sp.]